MKGERGRERGREGGRESWTVGEEGRRRDTQTEKKRQPEANIILLTALLF